MTTVLPFRGLLYRNEFFYNMQTFIKLGREYHLRYRIAAEYIRPGELIVDVCSGAGRLYEFLPKDCRYVAVEASPEFTFRLKKKGLEHICHDLHSGWPTTLQADTIVMVISLAQFRKTSSEELLERFKKAAGRVIIVEDVLPRPREETSWLQRAMNHLCATDYYVPVSWYTRQEFEDLMRRHGFVCRQASERYFVGLYSSNESILES